MQHSLQRSYDGPVRILLAGPSLPSIETLTGPDCHERRKPLHHRPVRVLKRKDGIIPTIHGGHDRARSTKVDPKPHVRAAIAMNFDCSAGGLEAGGRRQEAGGRRQAAGAGGREAGGRRTAGGRGRRQKAAGSGPESLLSAFCLLPPASCFLPPGVRAIVYSPSAAPPSLRSRTSGG